MWPHVTWRLHYWTTIWQNFFRNYVPGFGFVRVQVGMPGSVTGSGMVGWNLCSHNRFLECRPQWGPLQVRGKSRIGNLGHMRPRSLWHFDTLTPLLNKPKLTVFKNLTNATAELKMFTTESRISSYSVHAISFSRRLRHIEHNILWRMCTWYTTFYHVFLNHDLRSDHWAINKFDFLRVMAVSEWTRWFIAFWKY